MHLIIDGYGSLKLVSSPSIIESTIQDIVPLTGMRLIGGPLVVDYKGEPPGKSAVAIFAEGSITIHTFTNSGKVNFDLFSCKDFDSSLVEDLLMERLGLVAFSSQLLVRL